MSRLECDSCGDLVDVSWRTTTLPYICIRCEKDSALALEQDTYNSGVPCQSALDSVQEEQYLDPYCVGKTDPRVHAMHSGDVLDQFDEDTKLIDDLRLQLEQANLNIRILEETIADLEIQLTDLRLDICNVVFRTHF